MILGTYSVKRLFILYTNKLTYFIWCRETVFKFYSVFRKDTGRQPVDPPGTPRRPPGRDNPGAAVLAVVYNAATSSSNYHHESHDLSRRPHGHIFPDSGF